MFEKILVAVDLNDKPSMTKIAKAAQTLSHKSHAALHLVNVIPDTGMAIVSAQLDEKHSKTLAQQAKAELNAWMENVFPDKDQVSTEVAIGTVYDQILKRADAAGCDAIIIGAHRPELKDYLIGPNSARVARHAKQSVFVVR